MKLNTPLPQPLPKECAKAAKIFQSFVDNGNNGLDGVIPRHVLEHAKGFAIFTVFKAGFLLTARAGSGVVIARLDDGTWSAPSAIGTAGLGIGGQAGAEMTDFLIVLNTRSAIKSFMAAGSLTLGGNMSIAVGPLGRNGEAIGAVNSSGSLAAMYSYSKTKGLFGGVSIEGSVIVERQDANSLAYHQDVSSKMLLSGGVPPPEWADSLIKTIEACTGVPGISRWIPDQPPAGEQGMGYAFGGVNSRDSSAANTPAATGSSSSSFLSFSRKKRSTSAQFPPAHWGTRKNSGSYFTDPDDMVDIGGEEERRARAAKMIMEERQKNPSPTAGFETHFDTDFLPEDVARRHPHLNVSPSNPTTTLPPSGGADQYQPGSPFNSLPPFDLARSRVSSNSVTHNRSVSAGSFLPPKTNSGNPFSRPAASPLSQPPTQSQADPFSLSPALSSDHGRGGGYDDFDDLLSDNFMTPDTSGRTMSNKPIRPLQVKPGLTSQRDFLSDDFMGSDNRSRSTSTSGKLVKPLQVKPGLSTPLRSGVGRAIALYDFGAVESGDLSFKQGDVITIIEKSDSTDAWWRGEIGGRTGIFPANFVEVV